jgi:hypothetical protein
MYQYMRVVESNIKARNHIFKGSRIYILTSYSVAQNKLIIVVMGFSLCVRSCYTHRIDAT